MNNVQVVPVYLGFNPTPGSAQANMISYMDGFFKTLFPSGYLSSLSEYNVTEAGANFAGTDYILTGDLPAFITDSSIQQELQAQITAGFLPQPNASTLYMVFTAPGTTVIWDTQATPNGQVITVPGVALAYHFDSQVGGVPFSYSVDATSAADPTLLTLNGFPLTEIASHEIGEAITDPAPLQMNGAGVNTIPLGTNFTGWFYTPMSAGGEIGDLCQSASPLDFQGYTVQQLWTNFLGQSNFSNCGLIPSEGVPQLPGQPTPNNPVARIIYHHFHPAPAAPPPPHSIHTAPHGAIGSPQNGTSLPYPVQPYISVSPANPLDLALSSENGLQVSTNGGQAWSQKYTFPIASLGDSATVYDKSGNLYWANVNSTGGISISKRNPKTGAAVAGPFTVDAPPAGYKDTEIFLTADDINDSPQDNSLFLTWTQLGPNNSSEILLSRSSNGGQTWSAPVQASGSGANNGGEGYDWGSTVSVAPNGEVFVAYHSQPGFSVTSDGGIVPDGSGQVFVVGYSNDLSSQISKTLAFASGQSDVTSNVQTGNRTLSGMTFLTQGSWTPYVLADPNRPGTVYVVAANDPNAGNSGDVDHSNIVLATSSNYGNTWSTSTIESAPSSNPNSSQLFPTANIDVNGDILVSWYSNQSGVKDAQGDYELGTYAAYSTDGGQTFSTPFQVGSQLFDPNPGAVNVFNGPPATTAIGNSFGVAIDDGSAYVAYDGNTLASGKATGQQVEFASLPIAGSLTIFGAEGDNTIRIVQTAKNSGIDEVILNGATIFTGSLASIAGGITISRNSNVDVVDNSSLPFMGENITVTLDYSNSDPLPAGGMDFEGSAQENNTIQVTNANASYVLSNTSLTITIGTNTDTVTLDNVQNANLSSKSSRSTFTLDNWSGSTTINGGGGTVVVQAGTVQTSQLTVSNVQGVQIAGGMLDVNAHFTAPNVQVDNGATLQIENADTLFANVANSGILNAIGAATIDGNYTQNSNGTLNIGIGGSSPGVPGYDQLAVTGIALLNGTLNVSLRNGFTPSSGEMFDILTYASESGDFALKNLPNGWSASPGATSYVATAP